MPISHFGLTFSPVVTLHVEWWKMVTKNRSSSTLGRVPHRLGVSTPLPMARPVHASTALGAFYILRSSFNPHSHSEVGNWGTEKLRNSQGPSSSVWLLSPRSAPLPVLLCRGPACLPFPSLPLSSLPSSCWSLSWNALPNTPSWWSLSFILSQCPILFLQRKEISHLSQF